jgi:hypothetical protein
MLASFLALLPLVMLVLCDRWQAEQRRRWQLGHREKSR